MQGIGPDSYTIVSHQCKEISHYHPLSAPFWFRLNVINIITSDEIVIDVLEELATANNADSNSPSNTKQERYK
jgi:hypothetical protein